MSTGEQNGKTIPKKRYFTVALVFILTVSLFVVFHYGLLEWGKSSSIEVKNYQQYYSTVPNQTLQEVIEQGQFSTQKLFDHNTTYESKWVRIPLNFKVPDSIKAPYVLFSFGAEPPKILHTYVVNNRDGGIVMECIPESLNTYCHKEQKFLTTEIDPEYFTEDHFLYMQLGSSSFGKTFKYYVMERDTFYTAVNWILVYGSFVIGVFFLSAIVGFVFFFGLRDTSFVFWALFVLFMTFNQIVNRSVIDLFLPDWMQSVQHNLNMTFSPIGAGFLFFFYVSFFNCRKKYPWCFKFYTGFGVYLMLLAIPMTIPQFRAILAPTFFLQLFVVLIAWVNLLVWMALRNEKWSIWMLVALTGTVSANGIWALFNLDVISGHWITSWFGSFGILFDIMIINLVVFQKLQVVIENSIATEMSKREHRVVTTLFRTISHDLSTYTQGISSCLYFLKKSDLSPKSYGEEIFKLEGYLTKLSDIIINAKRNYAIRKNQSILSLGPVSLRDSFRQIRQIFDFSLQEKNINLEIKEPNEAVFILAEPVTFVHQILANLISNAIKFSPPGETLKVWYEESTDSVTISIWNKGEPLPAEFNIDELEFNKSFVSTSAENTSGSGQGLLIVRDFTRMSDGTVTLQPHPEGGTLATLVMGKPNAKQLQFDSDSDNLRISI